MMKQPVLYKHVSKSVKIFCYETALQHIYSLLIMCHFSKGFDIFTCTFSNIVLNIKCQLSIILLLSVNINSERIRNKWYRTIYWEKIYRCIKCIVTQRCFLFEWENLSTTANLWRGNAEIRRLDRGSLKAPNVQHLAFLWIRSSRTVRRNEQEEIILMVVRFQRF